MLRGVHDSRWPMVMALIGYWAIGAPIGVALALLDAAARPRPVDRPRLRPRRGGAAIAVALARQGAARVLLTGASRRRAKRDESIFAGLGINRRGRRRSAPADGRHAMPARRDARSSSTSTPASTTRSACSTPAPRRTRALVGVSTVAGNVDLASATRNTRAVLALAGRADIPVWPGCAAPMLHAPQDASDRCTARAASATPCCPSRRARPAPAHAIDAIVAAGACARRANSFSSPPDRSPTSRAALLREPALPRLARAPRADGRRLSRGAATSRRRRSSTSGTIRKRRASCFAPSAPTARRRSSPSVST